MENEIVIDKKAKRILIIASVLIFGPLIGLIYWKVAHSISGTDLILKEASEMAFHGKVDSIYFEKMNHNAEILILSDSSRYGLYGEWEQLVTVGDSLTKDTGTLEVAVYHKNGKVEVLDYRKLIQSFK